MEQKCHFDEMFISGCDGSYHLENFQCGQLRTFHQNVDISFSVYWWELGQHLASHTNVDKPHPMSTSILPIDIWCWQTHYYLVHQLPVASFTKEVNSRLVKRPLVFNGRLANRGLTSLVKKATGVYLNIPDIYEMLLYWLGRVDLCTEQINHTDRFYATILGIMWLKCPFNPSND